MARQRTKKERAGLILRPCLKCRGSFLSEGSHNRLCETCKKPRSFIGQGKFANSLSQRKGPGS